LQSGANADALSHEEYLNAPGEKVSTKFTTPGKYSYCESLKLFDLAGRFYHARHQSVDVAKSASL
jgi:plastocyanin